MYVWEIGIECVGFVMFLKNIVFIFEIMFEILTKRNTWTKVENKHLKLNPWKRCKNWRIKWYTICRQIWGKDVFQATFCDDLSKKDEGTTGTKTLYFLFLFGYWNNERKIHENSNCCYGKSRSNTHLYNGNAQIL